MRDQLNAPRRVLLVEARPEALDALMADVAALLAGAGCPVRRIVAAGARPTPPGVAALGAGDLVLVPESRTARRGGHDLTLTRTEFDLLLELLRHPNQVLTKDALLDAVWRHEPVSSNAIEARVSRLRAKLERYGPRVIHTVRGVGYVLHALPDPGGSLGIELELVPVDGAGPLPAAGAALPRT